MEAMRPFDACKVPLTGTNLVEASAGTGKTYAITTVLVRLLLERELDIERILVVTFTEAATAELRDRVRKRLRAALRAFDAHARGERDGDDELARLAERSRALAADRRRLEIALHDVDLASIFTIHGFCYRVLQDCAFESDVPFDAEILTDDHLLRDEIVGDFWARELCSLPAPVVGRLLHEGFDLKRCATLVSKALRHPDAPVLPEPTDPVDLPSMDEFTRAWDTARACWNEQEVFALLASGNLKYYRKDWARGWCSAMSSYLQRPPDYPHLIKMHRKFCASSVRDAVKVGKPPEHPFFDACEPLKDVADRFDAWTANRIVSLHRDLVAWARTEMARRKEVAGVLSFDDLLQSLRSALQGPHGDALAASIRRRYAAALIDEFQDTDPVQYDIFGQVFDAEGSTLFTIGDPKQAIYSFRGADVFAYLQAVANTPADRRFTMGVNWRSDPGLLDAIHQLYARLANPFLIPEIGFTPVEPRPDAGERLAVPELSNAAPFEIVFVRRADHEKSLETSWVHRHYPDMVAAEISKLLASGATIEGEELVPSQIAVLTRMNVQAFAIQEALRRLRIPSVVLGDESVFESREAEELQRVLGSVVEPNQGNALRAALATELLGVTANELARMEEDEAAWEDWVLSFREWNRLWATKGFVQMFRALMVHRDVQRRLLSLTDGERRMTNVLHLMELLHTAARTRHLGPAGLLHWLAEQRTHARLCPESAQVRLESDDRAVRITTVHRSKGLEYGVVFCPYLWDGMLLHREDKPVLSFHDEGRGNGLMLEVSPGEKSPSYARAEWEKLAENLRLLYVALTRAKHRCTIFWGARYEFEKSALGYLLHPQQLSTPTVESTKDHLKGRQDEELLAELEQLASARSRASPCGSPIRIWWVFLVPARMWGRSICSAARLAGPSSGAGEPPASPSSLHRARWMRPRAASVTRRWTKASSRPMPRRGAPRSSCTPFRAALAPETSITTCWSTSTSRLPIDRAILTSMTSSRRTATRPTPGETWCGSRSAMCWRRR